MLDILDSALHDKCPEVNVVGCSVLAQMAQVHGQALAAVSKQLVAFAMPLLTHRMQKASRRYMTCLAWSCGIYACWLGVHNITLVYRRWQSMLFL